ncbi:MAG: NapC/NirT family cytochrome c [Longimicrobiales bacterium]
MSTSERTDAGSGAKKPSLLQNWVSLIGIILAASSFFSVLALIALDVSQGFPNPYIGILTYMVAPGFLILGLVLMAAGALLERRRRRRVADGEIPEHPVLDLNVERHRRTFVIVAIVTFLFFLVSAVGSYRTYHFTESVEFCGQTCHSVMNPEFTAYQGSPHARVDCVQCHIGPGADWFVKSKLSGAYQVYATLANVYPRPIPTPIENLRPAQETCEQCHWPRKFFGNVERANEHFFSNEENTSWTIRLLMKIGGGDPEFGRAEGIHWHMNIDNKVEYIATDHERQVIPWVRVTDSDGNVTVYEAQSEPLAPEEIEAAEVRQMDCIDCHNRPSHIYDAPAWAVNLAMSTGRISPELPFIKRTATAILTAEYETTEAALAFIEDSLTAEYADLDDQARVSEAVNGVKAVYQDNFFPEMKVNWRAYPDNLGHTIFPGCYRCHDGQHVSAEGQVVTKDCNSCHVIIAQGNGEAAETISPDGLEFQHPIDISEMWKMVNCAECHTGAS